jgi:RNase P subunit RPR2
MEKGIMVTKNSGEEPKKKAAGKSKQIERKEVVSITGLKVRETWCRKCMKMMPTSKFYSCTTPELDSNGFMSICKDCVNSMYLRYYETEKNIDKTILRLCRLLNVKFDPDAIESVKSQINTYAEKGSEFGNVFGVYKAKLHVNQSSEFSKREAEDLSFVEPVRSGFVSSPEDEGEDNIEISKLKDFWGDLGFTQEEYLYLKKELKNLKDYHKIENYAEVVLAKEVCFKLLDIRNSRIEGKSTDKLVKDLQELMKNLAISPNMANVANQGKNLDVFGNWVKDIEQFEPAEWWDQKREKYVDVNGWGRFAKNHIIRTIQNTLGLTKNFTLSDEKELEYDDDSFVSEESEDANSE